MKILFLILPIYLHVVSSFYIPGVAPKEFQDNELVTLYVNKITSTHTQLPYKYNSLPVCKVPGSTDKMRENLGEILSGDRIEESPYEIHMKKKEFCKSLCQMDYKPRQLHRFTNRIKEEYRVHWLVDNLPGTMRVIDNNDPNQIQRYEPSFPLGLLHNDEFYLYNHFRFTFQYHENPSTFSGARVVGFLVEPFSIEGCNPGDRVTHDMTPVKVNPRVEQSISWTYDVTWEYSDVPWASRWDVYLEQSISSGNQVQIHWFSIMNSLMIVLFLSAMVALIMFRTLHKDIAKYNDIELDVDESEFGWKLVHGDVFRTPQNSMLLCLCTGSGIQVLVMVICTLAISLLGFLSPSNRGALGTVMLGVFVLGGYPAGYVSARLSKLFAQGNKNLSWKKMMVLQGTLYPFAVFMAFLVVDLVVWGKGSSGAVPFGTLFAIFVLWMGVSVPLSALGTYHGFKKEAISIPVRANQIPREIPEQPCYLKSWVTILFGGVLPFGAVFIEVFFIMSSLWMHQIYYLFGFLLLVFLILAVTCAEITIVLCYFHLSAEDYNWFWRSFFTSGASAGYLYLYSAIYYFTKLEMTSFTAGLIYFTYMAIISLSFFLMTGAIGFLACFLFMRKIYGAIKVD
eukprot:snap_masked-scaffold_9-processed-gene-10.12-mRNA-1 protein AED:0.01 eAED:0.01 QI:0/-1/0/1/-1/1/1/0/622